MPENRKLVMGHTCDGMVGPVRRPLIAANDNGAEHAVPSGLLSFY